MFSNYCNSLTEYSRRKTRTVNIGDVPMGSDFPIRVQSMTTTDTMDTIKTVEQSIRMIDAGCEYVRITAPSINEAKNLENIKRELLHRGYKTPLVADIHFTPNAAEVAARIVEKVRINPGNFADKKKFDFIEYTDATYNEELERIRERFLPLLKICKEYGTAMRIGTNHGSLSDRIMSRYGDTAIGMVESALEFLRICRDENYHQIVLSMKSSNPQVMIEAYRLLVARMNENDMDYPLHLGVTEAGDGEDGRTKSAVGIGALLEDGLGDTVRVSLTEDPEFEIPVAKKLVEKYSVIPHSMRNPLIEGIAGQARNDAPFVILNEGLSKESFPKNFSPFEYKNRETDEVYNFGKQNVPRVIIDLSHKKNITEFELKQCGHIYDSQLDKWHTTDQGCDYIYTGSSATDVEFPSSVKQIVDYIFWLENKKFHNCFPFFSIENFDENNLHEELNFVSVNSNQWSVVSGQLKKISKKKNIVLVVETEEKNGMQNQRQMFFYLLENEIKMPIIIRRTYSEISADDLILRASSDIGALLCDGFGNGVWLAAPMVSAAEQNRYMFGILQACRTRISKTEYISCPSCGRTLFDLQETTAMIRKRTGHLKGVKIAIMGCIVNGPGEMADADYGYVGSGVGKITLYKGKDIVKRNINSENAVNELIELIDGDGRWEE